MFFPLFLFCLGFMLFHVVCLLWINLLRYHHIASPAHWNVTNYVRDRKQRGFVNSVCDTPLYASFSPDSSFSGTGKEWKEKQSASSRERRSSSAGHSREPACEAFSERAWLPVHSHATLLLGFLTLSLYKNGRILAPYSGFQCREAMKTAEWWELGGFVVEIPQSSES